MTLIEQRLTKIERLLTVLVKEKVKQEKEYLTLAEASEKFGVGKSTIRRAKYTGELQDFKQTKNGRNIRYSVEELEKVFAIKNK